MAAPALSYRVLGSVEVARDGVPVALGGVKARTIMAALLVNSPRIVSTASLIEILWGNDAPDRANATLQVHVSHLRKRLGDGRPTIVTQVPGYYLAAGPGDLDLHAFEELAASARMSADRGCLTEAAELLREALSKWSGAPLEGIEAGEFAERSRAWLDERRLSVGEDLVALHVHLGNHRDAVRRVDELLIQAPLRESLWELKMLALYRTGRQADALAAFQQCRKLLDDELGVDPSPKLRALEQSVLRQDAALDAPAGTPPPEVNVAVTVTTQRITAHLELGDGSVRELVDPLLIGRHPDCHLVLSDPGVSRQHAEIRPAMGGHLLSDLGSANGTRVNGNPETHRMLEPDDLVQVGSHILRYRRSGA